MWYERLVQMPGDSGGKLACVSSLRLLGLAGLGAVVVLVGGMTRPEASSHATSASACLGKPATRVGTRRADDLVGTKRPDAIAGLGGNDSIDARGGNDLICGGAGNDTLLGGAGVDRLDGGPGRDTCLGGERLIRCEETRRPVTEGLLAPGAYATRVFTPRFGFAVEAGWSAPFGEGATQLILLQRRDPGGLSITLDSFARRQSVTETIARFARIEGVQASGETIATIGGATGRRIDLLVTADQLVLVPGLAERYELESGDRLGVYAVGVSGATVSVLVEAPAAEFQAFVPVAERLLDTVRWS